MFQFHAPLAEIHTHNSDTFFLLRHFQIENSFLNKMSDQEKQKDTDVHLKINKTGERVKMSKEDFGRMIKAQINKDCPHMPESIKYKMYADILRAATQN